MKEKDRKPHSGVSQYADPSPYPEVRVLGRNAYYADLLIDDYAGIVSEFTAISQYLFHHYYFEHINKELGNLMEQVSITEMHHMELLAETIVMLGGSPQIRGGQSTGGDYWNGSFIYYGSSLCDQLKADLDSEYKAIAAYQQHIALIHDPYIQNLLQRIILDEKVHIRLFNQALCNFCSY